MEYIIDKQNAKKRLDVYISEVEDKLTRSYIKKLIETKMITVNSRVEKSGYSLKVGDMVFVPEIEPQKIEAKPEDISLDLVYEDDDIIVINKPRGMVVHPAHGNFEKTLVNALMFSHGSNLSTINGVIRPGIVHRIDKDTSGILVVAKNDNAHKKLSEQFKVHSIKREYLALVNGIINKDEIDIDLPIGRNTKDRIKMAVTNINSKRAVTRINILHRFINSRITLIKARLETGRTHQIRVHMSYLGYPLVGDKVYSKNYHKFKLTGQMLHATTLGFIHPTTGKYVEFTSEPDQDFKDFLDLLKRKEQ